MPKPKKALVKQVKPVVSQEEESQDLEAEKKHEDYEQSEDEIFHEDAKALEDDDEDIPEDEPEKEAEFGDDEL